MAHLLMNIKRGINHRIKKIFYRPLSIFDIGWAKEKFLKHQTDTSVLKYHLYKNKFKINFFDASSFLVSIDELFVKEFYKFRTNKNQPKIIDCGSYIGTSILYFKLNYPNALISGFEPDKTNYSLLKSNIENWDFSDININNAAIWINNESISFNSAGNMSSRIENDINEINNKQTVKCVRLNDLLNEEIDFLKIDIEGAEFEVLKDCSDNLQNIKNLFVEYHGNYSEMFKLNKIVDILLQNNFKYCIKEGVSIYSRPFWDQQKNGEYDMLLNIFAFRD